MKNINTVFSLEILNTLKVAREIAKENQFREVHPPHLLLGLLHNDSGLKSLLFENDIDVFYIEEWAEVKTEDYAKSTKPVDEPALSIEVEKILEEAENISKSNGYEQTTPLCTLISVATPGIGLSYDQLKTFIPDSEQLKKLIHQPIKNSNHNSSSAINKSKYLTDILNTEHTIQVVARDKEILDLLEILGRHNKPHVIVTGESGIGKSILIHGISKLIKQNKASLILNSCNVYEICTSELLSGITYKSELEDRLRKVFRGFDDGRKSLIFIDDISAILNQQTGNNSISLLLKTELSRGNFILLTTSSNETYRKTIDQDNLIKDVFEKFVLEEPNFDNATEMTYYNMEAIQKHHAVIIEKTTIHEAVKLAGRHFNEKLLPCSAIDLIDRTMASIRTQLDTLPQELEGLKEKLSGTDPNITLIHTELRKLLKYVGLDADNTRKESLENCHVMLDLLGEYISNRFDKVDVHDLASTVGRIKNIPAGKILSKERDRLLNMEFNLQSKVIGQDSAATTICESILESRSGLKKANLPIGSFFLLGPTGTGKTELAKQLANYLFQSPDSLIRFDMSEFKEEHSAALLYGAPPGYVGYEEGGMLVNKIRQKPYAVVLFDEIEKAHPSVFDIFLQILDEGKLNDRLGKTGDFSNAVILFTSNIGSQSIVAEFNKKNTLPNQTTLMEHMSLHFRPEFLGRLTGLVPFAPITKDNIVKIFDIQLAELLNLMENQNLNMSITNEVRELLALEGYTPEYGARPLRGVIRTQLRTPLSRMIISEQVCKGDHIHVELDENKKIKFNITKPEITVTQDEILAE